MPPKITRKQAKLLKDVYRGYKPPDLPQDRPPNRIKWWWKVIGKPMLTVYPKPEVEEWSKEPEYPPLNDASPVGLRRQVRLDWYESIKSKPTAEDKLYEIDAKSMQRMAHINNWLPTSNSLPFVKYLTQTHVIDSLPVGYDVKTPKGATNSVDNQDDLMRSELDVRIQQMVLEQVALSKYGSKLKEGQFYVSKQIRDGNRRSYVSNRLIEFIVNQLKKTLVYETNPQLLDYQIDLSPAIRSWWYHSGFESPSKKVFYLSRKDDDGNVNTIFQMDGSSALNIRHEHMLEPIVELSDTLVTDKSLIENCNYLPTYYGAQYKFKWPVALPGFWFENTPRYDCPHTCFLNTDCLTLRNQRNNNLANKLSDVEDCLTSQAILTAFGWLNGLSMYHGYTPFQELDYPFTCHVVTTDGQNWLFNVFQMNSHAFHRDLGGSKRNNICWSSGLLKLYEDYQDGDFIGVNHDVIGLLVKFISKQTSQEYTNQLNLRPFIHEDQRSQEEKEKVSKGLRCMFEGRYNRWLADQYFVPEWEKIFFRSRVTRYQIQHMKPKWHVPKPKYPKVFD